MSRGAALQNILVVYFRGAAAPGHQHPNLLFSRFFAPFYILSVEIITILWDIRREKESSSEVLFLSKNFILNLRTRILFTIAVLVSVWFRPALGG